MKKEVNLFWFKRDLRLQDNAALKSAVSAKEPLLLLYIIEPSLEKDEHYSGRHFRFIKESLADLNIQLLTFSTSILCLHSEVIPAFEQISKSHNIRSIFSTLEVGIQTTFDRDLAVKEWCRTKAISWLEFRQNAITRGRKNRKNWREELNVFLESPLENADLDSANFLDNNELIIIQNTIKTFELKIETHDFQKGGREHALRHAESFFSERIKFYSSSISKPDLSRISCSRLSPYLAWGCVSAREIFQRAMALAEHSPYQNQLGAFTSRLKWQSHFIQKFESEIRMEKEAVNRGFLDLAQPYNERFVQAWKTGKTGYPLVDASIRCIIETGYLNFRSRTLITSFLTHHLFQHFSAGAPWLAKQFLDFEPGIHYSQMQMQSGLTGINLIRVYNPTLNAQKHDPEAAFIKKYVPELSVLPSGLAIEPWKLTEMEQAMYGFQYGIDYPSRIVDIAETRQQALDKLFGQKNNDLAMEEIERILDQHALHRTESRFP